MKNKKYIATREIFIPASHRKNPMHFIRIKKGQVIETQVIDGKEVIDKTTTRVYYYLRTGALVRGTKLKNKSQKFISTTSKKSYDKKPYNRNNNNRKPYKKPVND